MDGGYAEQVVAAVETLVPVPDGVSLRDAAAVLHDGATAVGITDVAGIKDGDWVLVTAAAGGMGALLVQLARAAGARVIAAARGAAKLGLAREQGAEEAFDYTEAGWIDQVRKVTGGTGVNVVLDGAGGPLGIEAFEALAQGGTFVSYGTAEGFAILDQQVVEKREARMLGLMELNAPTPAQQLEAIARALTLVADGHIRPAIGQTYPLEQAAAAHTAIAARTALGKTLLLI